jgi:hypothetical protein
MEGHPMNLGAVVFFGEKVMRFVRAMLLTLAIGITTAIPVVSAQADGPSVCQYQNGTVLNFPGSPCPQQPFWTREDSRQRGGIEATDIVVDAI